MRTLLATLVIAMFALIAACRRAPTPMETKPLPPDSQGPLPSGKVELSEAEWRARLSPEAFHVLREKGTEAPFTSALNDDHKPGIFVCAACGQPLFSSDAKFDSGTGWPSFYQPIDPHAVVETTDSSYGMKRTEITCSRCGGHLGHVFDDGPKPTGLRYCINGVSLAKTSKP
ncbi:MAG: peptide-methionine (R)-S-oxide reductase MsrB [Polyangiales bacterium]